MIHSFGLQPSSVAWSLQACFNWNFPDFVIVSCLKLLPSFLLVVDENWMVVAFARESHPLDIGVAMEGGEGDQTNNTSSMQ